ncbi:MAG: DUF2062 domain-containing protein [Desulfobacteraceae bacterium]|jgi:uncharacterized protein (DUF2062 family)
MANAGNSDKSDRLSWKQRLNALYIKFKSLNGDPHYVAMGMAVGVFVAVTPTIPFHMAIAVALAFALKASKPAAVIGVWFSNPITVPPLYYGSYKLGMLMLGCSDGPDPPVLSLQELLKQGVDVTIAMIIGGAVLGIVPATASYFVTRYFFRKLRARRRAKKLLPSDGPKGL